jgi:hypothetical protein
MIVKCLAHKSTSSPFFIPTPRPRTVADRVPMTVDDLGPKPQRRAEKFNSACSLIARRPRRGQHRGQAVEPALRPRTGELLYACPLADAEHGLDADLSFSRAESRDNPIDPGTGSTLRHLCATGPSFECATSLPRRPPSPLRDASISTPAVARRNLSASSMVHAAPGLHCGRRPRRCW